MDYSLNDSRGDMGITGGLLMIFKFVNSWKMERWGQPEKWAFYFILSKWCFCPLYVVTPNGKFVLFGIEINYDWEVKKNLHFTILNFDFFIGINKEILSMSYSIHMGANDTYEPE